MSEDGSAGSGTGSDGEVPDGLAWHYTDGPGLLAILSTHTLWATSAAFLNDREEVRLGGRLIGERILEHRTGAEPAVAGDLAERVRESTERGEGPGPGSAYILSASRSPDSLAMWRLYGGTQESYALGLDPDVPLMALAAGALDLTTTGRRGAYLRHQGWRPVRYRREEQVALVDAALARLGGLLRDLGPDLVTADREHGAPPQLPPGSESRVEDFLESLQEALLLVKHEGFADERETRYAVLLALGDDEQARVAAGRLLSYRASAYGIAPYLRLTGPDPDGAASVDASGTAGVVATAHPLPVRAVAVSPSPNGVEAGQSVRQVLLAHGYDVPVRRSVIPFRG